MRSEASDHASCFPKSSSPTRLLHVAESPASHRLIEEFLEPGGSLILEQANNGAQVLRDLITRPAALLPNLILIPPILPALTGAEFTVKLKAVPQLALIPVIALGYNLPRAEVTTLYGAGVSCVISLNSIHELDELSATLRSFRVFWTQYALLPVRREESTLSRSSIAS